MSNIYQPREVLWNAGAWSVNFRQDNMPKKPQSVEQPRSASANANANASGVSPSKASSNDDDLPLMWEKVSDKLLQHINSRAVLH